MVYRLLLGYRIVRWAGIIIDNICPGIIWPGDNCHLSRHSVLYFKCYYIDFELTVKVYFWPKIYGGKFGYINLEPRGKY